MNANPKKSNIAAAFILYPVIDYWLRRHGEREMTMPVYKELERGSKPDLSFKKHVIPRQDVVDEIKELMFSCSTPTRFVVVIGPSGCGKTTAIREVCNKFPKGVVYTEIMEPRTFVRKLSNALNMKVAPRNFLDVLLGYVSERYTQYHVLPESQPEGINTIAELLIKVAKRYKQYYGKIPILVIDGVDLLAKNEPEACASLVIQSKILANEGLLKVVLVSSEGTIMPILDRLSAMNRGLIYEVGDVSYEKAHNYLTLNGIPKDVATELVKSIGGRLVHLESSIVLMRMSAGWRDEDVPKKVKSELFDRSLNAQKSAIRATQPESGVILAAVSQYGYVSYEMLSAEGDDEQREKIEDVISKLICCNVLRYNKKGFFTWHGQVEKDEFETVTKSE